MKSTAVCVYPLLLGILLVAIVPATAQLPSLVALGSSWKYLDTGTDPGGQWRALSYDDGAWPSGPAQLGFGDGDESTLISRTDSLGQVNITYYFRHAFSVPDPAALTNLLVRLRRDDGAAVYLNGTEVFRSNLPQGSLVQSSLAIGATSDDGTNFYASPVNPLLLQPGVNLLAVEVHQSSETSSDLSFDLELVGNVQFQPPSVAITSPTNGASVGSLNLTVNATASDPDGAVSLVEFFAESTTLGADAVPPYSVIWSNLSAGSYTLRAIATDTTGLAGTSAPVVVTIPARYVASGSTWKYLDTGVDPGSTWMVAAFDDGGWPSGPAEFGFGDGDEATPLSRTNILGGTNITYYFRHAFNAADTASVSNLVVRVLRDDGCVIHLNGVEVFRSNMPEGPVNHLTVAASAIDDRRFHASQVSRSLLLPGVNIIAAEVHQSTVTSSDVSFDLELRPNVPATPPVIAITSPTNYARFFAPTNLSFDVTTSDLDNEIASVSFRLNGQLVGTDSTDPYTASVSNLVAGSYTVTAVATDVGGLSTTSAPVQFALVRPPVITSLVTAGSVWKYLDTGVDLGTAWRAAGYDDSGWKSGAGKLGSNDNPVTTIDLGPVGNRYITTYFRRAFTATNVSSYTNLSFRVLRDDGCVVYVNGLELFRMNMRAGVITNLSRALTIVGNPDETNYFPMSVEPTPGMMVEGINVLAVELHQSDPGTSDSGFDLGLNAIAPPFSPTIRISGNGVALRLEWDGTGYVLQSSLKVDGPYEDIQPQVATSPYNVPLPTGNRFYRLRQ